MEIECLVSLKEAAKLLDVSESLLYDLARKGKFPCFKMEGRWKFNPESIAKWIKEKEEEK